MRIVSNIFGYMRDIMYEYHDWFVIPFSNATYILCFRACSDPHAMIAKGAKEEIMQLLSDISQAYADGQVIFTVPERYTNDNV